MGIAGSCANDQRGVAGTGCDNNKERPGHSRWAREWTWRLSRPPLITSGLCNDCAAREHECRMRRCKSQRAICNTRASELIDRDNRREGEKMRAALVVRCSRWRNEADGTGDRHGCRLTRITRSYMFTKLQSPGQRERARVQRVS